MKNQINKLMKVKLIDTENEEETTIKIIKLTEEILGQIGIKQFELKSSNSSISNSLFIKSSF